MQVQKINSTCKASLGEFKVPPGREESHAEYNMSLGPWFEGQGFKYFRKGEDFCMLDDLRMIPGGKEREGER